jgi:hypothetical protein
VKQTNPWAESNSAARRARAAAGRVADALDRNLAGQPHDALEPLQRAYEAADADAERLRAQASAGAEESEPWAVTWAANSAGRDALVAWPDAAAGVEHEALDAAEHAERIAAGLPTRSTGTRGALTRAAAFARQAAARAHARIGRGLRPEIPSPPAARRRAARWTARGAMNDWDWADVAAAGIIARFLHEEGLGHTVRWVIDGGFNETQRALIAAGVRYGARQRGAS